MEHQIKPNDILAEVITGIPTMDMQFTEICRTLKKIKDIDQTKHTFLYRVKLGKTDMPVFGTVEEIEKTSSDSLKKFIIFGKMAYDRELGVEKSIGDYYEEA